MVPFAPACTVHGGPAAIACRKLSISHPHSGAPAGGHLRCGRRRLRGTRSPHTPAAWSATLLSTLVAMQENIQPAPTLQTWKLTLAYDGTDFRGWQVQPSEPTVQGELQAALGRVTGEAPLPQGSGRTDAGVHALGQVASFALAAPIPPQNLLRALNRTLPQSIRIVETGIVAETFHARHSAVAKTYEYRIFREEICPPALARYVLACPWPLDLEVMQTAGSLFEGEHDFLSFAATDPDLSSRNSELD